jgi:FkbM family methyltransferase
VLTFLRRLIRLPLRFVPNGRIVRIKSGPLRGWRWVTGSAPHGCWIGTYERDSQRVFVDNVHEGDVVYDIGANAGFFTLLASKLAGPRGGVYAFEPLPQNLACLRKHVLLNGRETIRVLPFAVAATSGKTRFAIAHNPSQGGLSEHGELEVEIRSLDDLVAAGMERPGFMKIDVEGAESEVLAGASALLDESHPTILLSTHGWQQHERCSAVLQEHGYALTLLRDGAADGNYMLLATFAASRAR